MYCLLASTMLRILFLFAVTQVVTATDECWWTGCQKNDWRVVGCEQYNRVQIANRVCDNGHLYQCCPMTGAYTIQTGGTSSDTCWWTGCQKNDWAIRGCQQYNRVQRSLRYCDNGEEYFCCPISGGGSVSPGNGGTTETCWWTGCQKNDWAVRGCEQYNRVQRNIRNCINGNEYFCCPNSGAYNGDNSIQSSGWSPSASGSGASAGGSYSGGNGSPSPGGYSSGSGTNSGGYAPGYSNGGQSYSGGSGTSPAAGYAPNYTGGGGSSSTGSSDGSGTHSGGYAPGYSNGGQSYSGGSGTSPAAGYAPTYTGGGGRYSGGNGSPSPGGYSSGSGANSGGHAPSYSNGGQSYSGGSGSSPNTGYSPTGGSSSQTPGGYSSGSGTAPAGGNSYCWWTGCQRDDWKVKGCEQYNMIQINSKRCPTGQFFYCCPKTEGTNTQTVIPDSGDSCWWTGCQKNDWAVRGCANYNRVQSNSRYCDNGQEYYCCPQTPESNVIPAGSCWWTGCQKNDWKVRGCDNYNRTQVNVRSCDNGQEYYCCSKTSSTNSQTVVPDSGGSCWWTGCQKNDWKIRGCENYNRLQKNKRQCYNGEEYYCCPKQNW